MCLLVDGMKHFAVLSMDHRKLLWADGDVWLKQQLQGTEAAEFVETVKSQCYRPPGGDPKAVRHRPSHEKLGWREWKLHWRPNSEGPAWPRRGHKRVNLSLSSRTEGNPKLSHAFSCLFLQLKARNSGSFDSDNRGSKLHYEEDR